MNRPGAPTCGRSCPAGGRPGPAGKRTPGGAAPRCPAGTSTPSLRARQVRRQRRVFACSAHRGVLPGNSALTVLQFNPSLTNFMSLPSYLALAVTPNRRAPIPQFPPYTRVPTAALWVTPGSEVRPRPSTARCQRVPSLAAPPPTRAAAAPNAASAPRCWSPSAHGGTAGVCTAQPAPAENSRGHRKFDRKRLPRRP